MLKKAQDIGREIASTPLELPHNIEAEQHLLGAILLNGAAIERVDDFLRPEHFYDALHAKIFELSQGLISSGKPATPVTLSPFFPDQQEIVPGLSISDYLGRLVTSATTLFNAREYGRLIYNLAARRRLIQVGTDLVESATDAGSGVSAADLIADAEAQLYSVVEKAEGTDATPISEAFAQAIEAANAAYQAGGRLLGLSTGLVDFDEAIGGLCPANLVILAGRPGMGKSALGMGIAMHAARSEIVNSDGEVRAPVVHVYSLEMTGEEIASRLLSPEAGIASSDLRRGRFSEDGMRSIVGAAERLQRSKLYIDQSSGLSIAQLAARARRAKRRYGCDLIVIDYLQLLRGSGRENRTQDVTEITVGLKSLAKELGVPVVALSQLSREVEKRSDKRPQLSDLRESGSIEQDADVVVFVYREEYYVELERPGPEEIDKRALWEDRMREVSGRAELIVAKQRHGSTGIIAVQFDGKAAAFSSLARVPFKDRGL